MYKGEAVDYLMARMHDDSPDLYLDITNMFKYLDIIYLDANYKINAKADFCQLTQKTTRFQTFLSKFNLLAIDARKSRLEWKKELYYKLNSEMKRVMIRETNNSICSYKEFIKECTMVVNRLEQIACEEKGAVKEV
jgi:hypothetical protein